jgi:hypothetical protein
MKSLVSQPNSPTHTKFLGLASKPYRLNETPKNSCGDFHENARDLGVCHRIVRVSRATDRLSSNRLSSDEGGNTMSRLSSKIVVAVLLGFTAVTASACTLPLTFDPGTSGIVITP